MPTSFSIARLRYLYLRLNGTEGAENERWRESSRVEILHNFKIPSLLRAPSVLLVCRLDLVVQRNAREDEDLPTVVSIE